MERALRPSTRRKGEGTKFEYRIQFQASRVPVSGWDKLVVSLLSIDTGRITVKTSRGVVRNGTCQWPEPIVETTKLSQNPSTGEFNDKLYKLFVQMGSLRAGILGEATINLTEYITAESPETVSLPLRNCSAGTVLHVKIQCLTPKVGIRDFEGQRSGSLDQECPGSVSEDNSSSSDISENPASGSLGSSASQNIAAVSYVPASQGHHRDEPPFIAGSQPNFDVADIASDRSSDPYISQESNKIFQSRYQSGDLNFSNLQSVQTELMNAKLSSSVKEYGAWVAASLPQKLEAAEATIRELQEETSAWERHARKLNVEVETFRQKLAFESKIGSEMKMKLSATEAECDSLKAEVEQLRALKVTTKRWSGSDNSRWEMEDSRRLVKALQEEVLYEKEVNANLQMQLCKTQDSNVNLLTALTELEETLEANNKVVEKITEANKKLEEELFLARRELEIYSKLADDAETKNTKTPINSGTQDSFGTLENLMRKEEELEGDHNDLTILNFKLLPIHRNWDSEVNSELHCETGSEQHPVFEAGVSELAPRSQSSGAQRSTDALELQVQELEAKILTLGDVVHALKEEKVVLQDKIREESDTRTRLETEAVKLGSEVNKLAMDMAARDAYIRNSDSQLVEIKTEKFVLDQEIQKLLDERQVFLLDSDAEKAQLLEELEEAHVENNRKTQRLEELMEEMESFRNVLDSHASENKALESQKYELLIIQEEQEARIRDLEELNAGLSAQILSLETQLTITSQDQANYRHIIESSKDEKLAYENEISNLQTNQTLLQEELQEASTDCAVMQEKLAALEIEMMQQHQDCENRENTLRLEIESILGSRKNLEQAAKNAEEALIVAQQDRDLLHKRLEEVSLIADEKENVASHAMEKVTELQAEKEELEKSLQNMEEKFRDTKDLILSHKALGIKLRDVSMELDASKIMCDNLTQKQQEKHTEFQEHLIIQEKQGKEFQRKIKLLEELLQKANMDTGSKETIEDLDVSVLKERLRYLEAELKASEERLVSCKKDFIQKETELMGKIECLELSNEELAAGLVDSGAEQLRKELIRLQNQNSFLSRKEQELLSQMHTQDVLQKEVKRLQEGNDLLEARLSKFVETSKNPFLLEKIVNLETELAEAVEANKMYKLQLKSVFDRQQLGDLDQIIEDLYQHKKKAEQLQGDLDNMHERYTLVSLQLAEAEAERGELLITVKNLKSMSKK